MTDEKGTLRPARGVEQMTTLDPKLTLIHETLTATDCPSPRRLIPGMP